MINTNIQEKRATMNGKPVIEIPAKTVINFKSGFQKKLLCDGPTFSAGTACTYSCAFCYVPDIMRKSATPMDGKKHEEVVIRRSGAVETLVKQLTDAKGRPKFLDANDRRVIYASPLVDVAGNMELVRETVEICKEILTLTYWDIRLLSKSNLLPKVAEGLEGYCGSEAARKRIIYGVSTGTLDDNLCKAFEQGTPLASKRIQSLHQLQDAGYRTFGMICPSLPQADYYMWAGETHHAIRTEKCEHVWAEVINARGESFNRTVAALLNAGYRTDADMLSLMSIDKTAWEAWSRATFVAHTKFCPPNKLRFLQYVNKSNEGWWNANKDNGAVLL